MSPISGFFRLGEQVAPSLDAARLTFSAYRSDFLLVVSLSGASALLDALGFGLIYLLLSLITGSAGGGFGMLSDLKLLQSPLFLTAACVVLLTLSVRVRHTTLRRTAVISLKSGHRAGELALQALRTTLITTEASTDGQKQQRNLLLLALKDIPFAAGFAARVFSRAAIFLVQAVVIFIILLTLSPLVTLALLVFSALLLGFLTVPFGTVLSLGSERVSGAADFRANVDWFQEHLSDPDIGEEDYLARARSVLQGGSTERQFRLRLEQRQERQTATLMLGYLYPLGAVVLALVYFYSSDYAPPLSEVAVYFLMFRQGVAALQGVAKSVMSVSRQHSTLSIFSNILAGRIPLDELAKDIDDDSDDD